MPCANLIQAPYPRNAGLGAGGGQVSVRPKSGPSSWIILHYARGRAMAFRLPLMNIPYPDMVEQGVAPRRQPAINRTGRHTWNGALLAAGGSSDPLSTSCQPVKFAMKPSGCSSFVLKESLATEEKNHETSAYRRSCCWCFARNSSAGYASYWPICTGMGADICFAPKCELVRLAPSASAASLLLASPPLAAPLLEPLVSAGSQERPPSGPPTIRTPTR